MIGNDIVDLNFAQNCHYNHPRYLDKLFTHKEQQQILHSKNPSTQLWLLWSMKEAAYKLYLQVYQLEPFYNPKGFECNLEHLPQVSFNNFCCYITSKTNSNYVISEANLEPQKMISKVINIPYSDYKSQSKILKKALKNHLAHLYNINFESLVIQKNKNGIPLLKFNDQILNISLTHHGHYGAYAY